VFNDVESDVMKKSELTYVYLFFLLVYLLTCSGHIGGDGFISYLTTKSIVEDGDIDFMNVGEDFGVRELVPNVKKVHDTALDRRAAGHEHFYSYYGMFVPFLYLPFYLAGLLAAFFVPGIHPDYATVFFVSLANCFVTALTCLYVFLFSYRFSGSRRLSFFAALIFGFGTFVFAYAAKSGFSEPILGLSLFAACYHAYVFREGSPRIHLIISGIYAGIALTTKFYIVFSIFILGLYILYIIKDRRERLKDLAAFAVSFGFFALVFLFFNWFRFGSIFETGYTTPEVLGPQDLYLRMYDGSIINTIGRIFALLLSPGKGLVFYAPVILLAIAGFSGFFKRHRDEALLFLGMFLVSFGLIMSLTIWHGGGWGSRYLYQVVPFIVIPALMIPSGETLIRRLKVFLILGLLVQFPSIIMNHYQFEKFTDENNIYRYRHHLPQFSPIVGGYAQFFSRVNRIFTGESLKYPATYRQYPETREYTLSMFITNHDMISMEGYDRFDLWINNSWDALEGKGGAVKAAVVLAALIMLAALYVVWKKLRYIVYGEPHASS